MYSVKVKKHAMIAHSLPTEIFGKAGQLHGATYVIELEFFAKQLKQHMVINIDHADKALSTVCDKISYQNLDDLDEFQGKVTTAEFMAQWIHAQVCQLVKEHFSGDILVQVHESHIASASYRGLC